MHYRCNRRLSLLEFHGNVGRWFFLFSRKLGWQRPENLLVSLAKHVCELAQKEPANLCMLCHCHCWICSLIWGMVFTMGDPAFSGRSCSELPARFLPVHFEKGLLSQFRELFSISGLLGKQMLFSNHHAINRILCKTLAEVRLPVYVLGGHG